MYNFCIAGHVLSVYKFSVPHFITIFYEPLSFFLQTEDLIVPQTSSSTIVSITVSDL